MDPRVGYRQNRGRGDQMLLNLTENRRKGIDSCGEGEFDSTRDVAYDRKSVSEKERLWDTEVLKLETESASSLNLPRF